MAVRQVLVVVGLAVVGGGAAAGFLVFRGKQMTDAVAELEQFVPPADWSALSRKGKEWRPIGHVTALGTGATGALRTRLAGPAGPGRQAAMVALGYLGADSAVPELMHALAGPDEAEGHAAAYALALYPETPKGVRALLDDASLAPTAKPRVYRALAWSRDKKSHKAVAKGLKEADKDIRLLAVQSLAKLPGADARAALVDALADPDAAVGMAAVEGLSRTGEERDEGVRTKVREMAGAESPVAKARALEVIARTYDMKAGPLALANLDHADPAVATAAAHAARATKEEKTVPKLLALLARPEPEVVIAAAEAIKELNPPKIDAQLFPYLAGPSPATRRAAALLVAHCDNLELKKAMGSKPWVLADAPVVPALLEDLTLGDPELTETATGALGSLALKTNFRKGGAGPGGWPGWWALVREEAETLARTYKMLDEAADIVNERHTEKYAQALQILASAEQAYDTLNAKGSTANYEGGSYGRANIRTARVAIRKTAKLD